MAIHWLIRHPKRILVGALLLLGLALGLPFILLVLFASRRLESAFAEAERLDPGWRIQDLEAKRREIPDEENSGLHVIAVKPLIPPKWVFWWHAQTPGMKESTHEEYQALQDSFTDLDPHVQLDGRQIKALRAEMTRASKALQEARKVVEMPRGRLPIQYAKDGMSTPLDFTQDTRPVATLLDFDALLRCQDQDLEGALTSCRGIFYVGRCVGDEPTLISMLVRIAIHRVGVKKLERILAQGQPSEPRLADFQRLLEEELEEPLLLYGARGERALSDCLMAVIDSGEMTTSQAVAGLTASPQNALYSLEDLQLLLVPGSVKFNRAELLRFHNRFVEIAKRPVEEQKALIEELDASSKNLPVLARALGAAVGHCAATYQRDRAELRCAQVIVAAERYRLARGRWPGKLDDLVGAYLKEVPLDPADGKLLKYRRDPGFISIYAVGADGKDHGGKVGNDTWKTGFDLGLRLWDVENRRQPPTPRANQPRQ
jgi:hypothetical protein